MAGGRATAVEVAVGASSGAGDTTLGVTADVNLGDGGGETGGGRGGCLLGGGGLHGGGSRLALGRGAGEGVEAGLRVAVVDGGSAPAVLRACDGY